MKVRGYRKIGYDYDLGIGGDQPRVVLEVERPYSPDFNAVPPQFGTTIVTPDGQTAVWAPGEVLPPWAAAVVAAGGDTPQPMLPPRPPADEKNSTPRTVIRI